MDEWIAGRRIIQQSIHPSPVGDSELISQINAGVERCSTDSSIYSAALDVSYRSVTHIGVIKIDSGIHFPTGNCGIHNSYVDIVNI